MAQRSECPSCGALWADEYTHRECPSGSSRSDHRHLMCFRCGQEWVEMLGRSLPANAATRKGKIAS